MYARRRGLFWRRSDVVIKGSARAAPGELAYHLLREDTNEAVRVRGFSGVASLDLREALAELDGMGAGSRSSRTLYHASINTPVSEQLTDEQQRQARQRLAAHLGFAGQPFAMVEHVKHGRQHTHIVWSRIDIDTGKAIPDSHNYRKHEEVARELEREFGHERVPGAHVRDKEAEPRPERGPSWGEQRQAERSGLTPAAAKSLVTGLWHQTATGREFRDRMEGEGFILARGDRRDFVLIDPSGEIHGLTRRIEGAKAAQVRARMADLDAEQLPDVAEARQQLRQRRQTQERVAAPAFTSAVERLKGEEAKRETEAVKGTRPSLRNSDQEAADAIWQLGKTMRGQIDATVAGGRLDLQRELAGQLDVDTTRVIAGSRDAALAIDVHEALPAEPERRPLLKRIAGWIRGKGPNAVPSPATAEGPERQKEAGRVVAAPSPEGSQQPSVEAENREGERNRPSAYLFIRVFGYLVDAYQLAMDRRTAELERQVTSRKPVQEDLVDYIVRQRAARTDEQKEAARAAALLREQESRRQDWGRERKPGD